ncbi:MAG TPA: adenylate/guanylate cyclase domain-containing protein [Candidatus Wallbacteria bacterium]|nr:adenylate/guanylate cyclase domain-containing protein [Candidatus Wallbacteria bacterium]
MDCKNLTIMFTDIKGFTQRTSQQSRSATLDLLKRHNDILIPIFEARKGRIIKTIGDAFLVVFESPTNAVLTGIELQKQLGEHNKNSDDDDLLEVRVAINTGEVSLVDNDVFGEAVNIASRLESISEANDVYFTESTYLAMNKAEVPTAEIGYRLFKGIPDKIKIFKVLREGHENVGPKPQNISSEKKETLTASGSEQTETVEQMALRMTAKNASAAEIAEEAVKLKLKLEKNEGQRQKLMGFILVPVCMFFFGALGKMMDMGGAGFVFGIGAGFLAQILERRKYGVKIGALALPAAFFLLLGAGIFFRTPGPFALMGIAAGLFFTVFFKRF